MRIAMYILVVSNAMIMDFLELDAMKYILQK